MDKENIKNVWNSRKAVSFEEQIMSKDKYSEHIFPPLRVLSVSYYMARQIRAF